VFRALARELLELQGAEEVHVHHLSAHEADELVDVYMFDGDGRVSYLLPRAERPPGVSWVAHSARSVLIVDQAEIAERVPRLDPDGIGDVRVAAADARARRGRGRRDARPARRAAVRRALGRSRGDARRSGGDRAGAGSRTGGGGHRRGRGLHEPSRDAPPPGTRRSAAPRARARCWSCILIDLDDFKAVNDVHGHQAGDVVLRAVVQALVGEFRAADRVARYGGDEFRRDPAQRRPAQRRGGPRRERWSGCASWPPRPAKAASRRRSASRSGTRR